MKNPFGYTIAIALEYIFITNLLFPVACALGYAFGSCSTLISIAKDITRDVLKLNKIARFKDDRQKISKEFSQLIEIHSNAQQLSA